jgi:D-amino-acid dehydrogenase
MVAARASAPGRHAVVVGGGIVGFSCALYLQKEGFTVSLVEKDGPGRNCSFGNAGNMGAGSSVQHNLAELLVNLPRLLIDPNSALSIRPSRLPRLVPWFMHFVRTHTPAAQKAIETAKKPMVAGVFDAYQPLLADAGATDMILRRGRYMVYRDQAALDKARPGVEQRRRWGLRVEPLTAEQLRERIPSLSPKVVGGFHVLDAGHCVNPGRLVETFARSFVERQGRLLIETVRDFDIGPDGPRAVITDQGRIDADVVIIAAGAWSRDLAKKLGSTIPLEAERGYHVMMPDAGIKLQSPVGFVEHNVILTPMEHGIRATGIAEFAALESPPNMRLADVVLNVARSYIPALSDSGATRWMGPRPSTPDYIPVIGRSPRFANVFYCFGHGHSGLGLGPVTGRLLSQIVAGKTPDFDPHPFRPDRF